MDLLWFRFKNGVLFEFNYYWRRLDRYQTFILILSFIQLIVISFGDVRSFLIGDNSLIPDSWTFLKDRTNSKIISVVFIVFLCAITWFLDNRRRAKEVRDVSLAVQLFGIPSVERDLSHLINRILRQRYNLTDSVRGSIFLPVRVGFFQWRLRMVCRTSNIPEKELDASFQFDEGVLGYSFFRANSLRTRRCHVDHLDVSGSRPLPSAYVELSPDNRILINSAIKAVAVLIFKHQESILGLLAIDSIDSSDLPALENSGLHSDATDWMHSKGQAIELLWRMANNV